MRCAALIASLVMAMSAAHAQEAETELVRPAKVITVEASADSVQRRYSAIVHPSQEAELSFKVSGQVIELPVRGAQQVVKGDVIAQLDKRSFEATVTQLQSQRDQALAELKALRSGARAEEVASLEANVAAARAQYNQAQDQLERTQQLFDEGIVAKARLEQDQAATEVALASLQSAEEQLAIGKAGGRAEEIEGAEAAIRGLDAQLRTAQDNLEDATLRAPFDGIIARRDIENFTNIQAGQTIVLLQALDVVYLAFDVPGPDVLIWASNDDVQSVVNLDAIPGDSLEAELVEFSTQADAGTQTYRARVSIDVPEEANVLPGMVGSVVVSSQTAANSQIAIPLTAIGSASDASPFVWVVDDASGAVSAQSVALGEMAGETVVVEDGLDPGMVIVTAGVSFLREGAKIRPISQVGD